MPYVSDVILEKIDKHHIKLEAHPNPLLEPLLQPANSRRLNDAGLETCKEPEVTSLDEYPNKSL
jgi:hypothetical protein